MRAWEQKLDEGQHREPCPTCAGRGTVLVAEQCAACGGVLEHVTGCPEQDKPR